MLERLQKIIARAGLASRRHAEQLMSSGLVTVNGRVVTELGSKADPSRDHIKVSGKLLHSDAERVYLILHKPVEVVSTMSDPEGRPSLHDLLRGVSERVFPVGRLEYHSSGLVFLTNDGDLANRILQSDHLPQTYQLKLKSLLTFEEIARLSRLTGARISRLRGADAPWYEVTLSEARRDALRKKLFQTGHPVEKMKRMRIGNLELESLPPGRHRALSPAEVAALSRALKGDLPAMTVRKLARTPPKPRPSRMVLRPSKKHSHQPSNDTSRRTTNDSPGPSKQPPHRTSRPFPRTGNDPRRPSTGGSRRTGKDSRSSSNRGPRRTSSNDPRPSRGPGKPRSPRR